jgi:hypothetical protein
MFHASVRLLVFLNLFNLYLVALLSDNLRIVISKMVKVKGAIESRYECA